MNDYLKDASLFLRAASRQIKQTMAKDEIVFAAMNFALGLERVLKGILFNVNPIYVLVEPKFANSVSVIYGKSLLADKASHAEISDSPNSDVITFRISLLRAQALSHVTFQNKGLIYALSSYRDIIAHHSLDKLNYGKLGIMLTRDFYPLVLSYTQELGIQKAKYLADQDIRLAKFSAKLQGTTEAQVKMKIEAQRRIWEMSKNKPGYIEDKDAVTREVLAIQAHFPVICPACSKEAILYARPVKELSVAEKTEVVVGYAADKLKCFYCKLVLEDYKELDFLKLNVPGLESTNAPVKNAGA